jgi:L-ascorbate metabolism protein UlaG (beta-lactamase superfamily)
MKNIFCPSIRGARSGCRGARSGWLLPGALWLFAFAAGCSAPGQEEAPLEITYIANEGFLIQVGEDKVLIDAFFDDPTIDFCQVPSKELLDEMEQGKGPFQEVNLVLVTHAHRDHFSTHRVAAWLRNHPEGMLVCPAQAAAQLKEDCSFFHLIKNQVREVSLDFHQSRTLRLNLIDLEVHRLHHCPYMESDDETGGQRNRHAAVENLAYLITMGNRKILHLGDAALTVNRDYFQGLGLQDRKVDVACLEFFDTSPESREIISRSIRPGHLVFMHLPAEEEEVDRIRTFIEAEFLGAQVYRTSMESRIY